MVSEAQYDKAAQTVGQPPEIAQSWVLAGQSELAAKERLPLLDLREFEPDFPAPPCHVLLKPHESVSTARLGQAWCFLQRGS